MLKLINITKNYYVSDQTIKALKGLTVDFRKNEFVAVLGPSGCGKTTLMNIIGGLDHYTDGDLVINCKSTKDFTDSEWDNYRNKKIGFVFQTYNLILHQTVMQNVELALTLSGISKEERRKRAKEALEQVGLGDQLKKRPNQLSGGQMQRVAIARALVNSPDILLADEPTGALDTQTSEQIMQIIKEIAKNRLVIMVTHNPDLANRFSTRIIRMVDGVITEDSMPYNSDEDRENQNNINEYKETGKESRKEKNKTSMSFMTALSLSLKNLNTKKGRTILTSFAGSIGIIGIALILAISSGINAYMRNLTTDTLSTNPIIISSTAFDIKQAFKAMGREESLEKFPSIQKILVEKIKKEDDIIKKNNIDASYVDFVKNNINQEWINDINYDTGIVLNFYGIKKGTNYYSSIKNGFSEMGNLEFTRMQYDAIYGDYPTDKNEIVIICDEYNKINEKTLVNIGLKERDDEIIEYEFSELIGKEFKIVNNDILYKKIINTKTIEDTEETVSFEYFKEKSNIDWNNALTLKVVGILRLKQDFEYGILDNGIGYTRELREWVQEQNMSSEIVNWMNSNIKAMPFSFNGEYYLDMDTYTGEELWKNQLRMLGGINISNNISIYPIDFEAKKSILKVLDKWNEDNLDHLVTYTDFAKIFSDTIMKIVNYISYALIAFTAISLLVSSVMIGIITYVSVLERTKEIGILRAIGARKIDITRVFNAETFLIGMFAGFIGVALAYLLSIPINIIVYSLSEVKTLASLPIYDALVLIFVSIGLTVISGLIPAFKAAKKDPVAALRTE